MGTQVHANMDAWKTEVTRALNLLNCRLNVFRISTYTDDCFQFISASICEILRDIDGGGIIITEFCWCNVNDNRKVGVKKGILNKEKLQG